MRLKDRIAIVTGGLSGIGEAIAARFAAEGAIVIAADIGAAAGPLGDAPVSPFRVDVAEQQSVRALADAVLARHGRIDCLVNSAGIGGNIPFLETSAEDFDRIIAVNLRGTFLVGQACARAMVQQRSGAIVNIGSISGLRGNVGRVAYGASKGGVVTLTQVMAVELALSGVRVNAIAPGAVRTPMLEHMVDAAAGRVWMSVIPMQRFAAPDEIAGAAVFLCSDDASFVTGHILAVDGGFAAAGLLRQSAGSAPASGA